LRVDFHRKDTIGVNNDEAAFALFIDILQVVDIQLLEALLRLDNLPVEAEASLLVRAHGIVAPLQSDQEVFSP